MNIQEATRLAMQTNQFIMRTNDSDEPFRYLPTNTDDCFVVYIAKDYVKRIGKDVLGKRWNPRAEDILADDWIVTPDL